MIESFRYSSEGQSEDVAFEAYRRLYARGSDVSRAPGTFRACVVGWRLDNLLLFDRRVSGVVHSRDERVATDSYDHLVLTLVVDGTVEGSRASGFDVASPGDIVLADTMRPSSIRPVDAHLVTASLDRGLVEAALGAASGLHGTVLRPPASNLLADYLRSLTRNASHLSEAALGPVARALVELLSGVDGLSPRAVTDIRRRDFARREAVERHIAEQLSDPLLSAETIAEATGISRSAIYRLFETHGGVARLIQRRRLGRLRARLDTEIADDQTPDLSALAMALGFSGTEAMKRQFRDAVGLSLTAYIDALRTEPAQGVDAAGRRWADWMDEL